jgi:hypothetical protein
VAWIVQTTAAVLSMASYDNVENLTYTGTAISLAPAMRKITSSLAAWATMRYAAAPAMTR